MEVEELLNQETKTCPDCAETIKLKAKKCRFCGSELDAAEVEKEVDARKTVLSEHLAAEREGKLKCPQCGNWDVDWAMTETGSHGHWCRSCKKSLQAMGFDEPGKPITTPKPPQEETKIVIEQQSSGVWKAVGVLLIIVLILLIVSWFG